MNRSSSLFHYWNNSPVLDARYSNLDLHHEKKKKTIADNNKNTQPIYTFIWITTVRSTNIRCSIKHLNGFFFIAPSISTKLIYPIKFDGYLYSQASCTLHTFHFIFRISYFVYLLLPIAPVDNDANQITLTLQNATNI